MTVNNYFILKYPIFQNIRALATLEYGTISTYYGKKSVLENLNENWTRKAVQMYAGKHSYDVYTNVDLSLTFR